MEEDCSLVFTTSRGQVNIAPTVPPHLEGGWWAGVRGAEGGGNMVRNKIKHCPQRPKRQTGHILLIMYININPYEWIVDEYRNITIIILPFKSPPQQQCINIITMTFDIWSKYHLQPLEPSYTDRLDHLSRGTPTSTHSDPAWWYARSCTRERAGSSDSTTAFIVLFSTNWPRLTAALLTLAIWEGEYPDSWKWYCCLAVSLNSHS